MAKRVKRRAASGEAAADERSPPRSKTPGKPKVSDRAKQLQKSIKGIEGFQLFSSVIRPIIVPTRITSLNRALCVGGFPCQMIGVLHGPSQGGKSMLLAEIIHAAVATGGWGVFIDAESRAVDKKWYACILGALDNVVYYRPKTFEECIEKIEEYRSRFRKAKEDGEVPEGAVFCAGVDSVNRLTPKDELEEIMKGKVEARGYPLRALLTSKWLDKIVPTLDLDESIVFIQREGKRLDAVPGQRTWKTKGGESIGYDAGWTCRVETRGNVKSGDDSGDKIGEKHQLTVLKNSMGPKLDEEANFYSSAGKHGEPLGFDFVREVREEAIKRGLLVYKSGKGYFYGDDVVAPSKKKLPDWLSEADDDGVPNWAKLGAELDREIADAAGDG